MTPDLSNERLLEQFHGQIRLRGREDERVKWKTYSYDQPVDPVDRLTSAGFVDERPETLLLGRSTGSSTSSACHTCHERGP